MLDKNWQRLVLTHLEEKQHLGVLTGAPLTDVKITLIAGRAHLKHTEGGDFRQATYRAVRQGLMLAKSQLLEPWYAFRLEVPVENLGRAMTDIQRMEGSFDPPESGEEAAVLTGFAPVATMRSYPMEVVGYTRGRGHLTLTLDGYRPCHNAAEIIKAVGYEPEHDLDNPADSVFCAHGAGFVVPWDQVRSHMHVDSGWGKSKSPEQETQAVPQRRLTAQHWKRMPSCSKSSSAPMAPSNGTRWRHSARCKSGNARILMPSSGKSCPNICWWTATISSLRGMS